MIYFIKRKVWVYQLAQNLQTPDNRRIKGGKADIFSVLNQRLNLSLNPIQMLSIVAGVTYLIIMRNKHDR